MTQKMNTQQALSSLRSFLDLRNAYTMGEELLNKLAFIEQEIKEAAAKRDEIKVELEKNGKALDKAKSIIAAAEENADGIILQAKQVADGAIKAAQDSITVNQSNADKKLADTNARISAAETKAIVAEGQAKEAADKLAAINAELEAAQERLKKLLGA